MTLDIVMPLYGRTDQFREAVGSVLSQTDGSWRLIVIDDHNPDPDAVEWYRGLDDPRLGYVRTEENLGPGPVFQLAGTLVESRRCVIIGCDDRLLPGFVERTRALDSRKPDVAMIQPGVRIIDDAGEGVRPLPDRIKDLCRPRLSGPKILHGERLASSLLRGNWLYFPSIGWRTDLLRDVGFRPDRHIVQDLTLELELILGGGTLLLDDEVTFEYRRHDASASSRARLDGRRFSEESDLFAEMERRMTARGWTRAARSARRHWTSRLNAAAGLAEAARAGDREAMMALASHALGRSGAERAPA